jgi:hypothetical protein
MIIQYYPLINAIVYSSHAYAYRSGGHGYFSLFKYMHNINPLSKYIYGGYNNNYKYVFMYKKFVEAPI